MEFIKKRIHQKTKISKVATESGIKDQIIPDLSAEYKLIICLTAEVHDLGIFDSGDKYMAE